MQAIIRPLSAIIYQLLIKKILFLFDAETVHNTALSFGKVVSKNTFLLGLINWLWGSKNEHPTQVGPLLIPQPTGLAAGFDYNGDLVNVTKALGFGFHTIGTITYEPYEGNTKPRLGRLPNSEAIIVNKGLKNIGVRAIIKKFKNSTFPIPTGFSVGATNKLYANPVDQISDICKSFYLLEKAELDHAYYELNISCPNTFGGEPFTNPKRLTTLLQALSKLSISRPIFVKMPIDQSENETLKIIEVIQKFKIAGVIMGNLTKDKTNPAVTDADRSTWKNTKGNLSGQPTRLRSLNHISAIHKFAPDLPIIGCGGVFSTKDANEKIQAGASAIQLISGMIFRGPQLVGQLSDEIKLH